MSEDFGSRVKRRLQYAFWTTPDKIPRRELKLRTENSTSSSLLGEKEIVDATSVVPVDAAAEAVASEDPELQTNGFKPGLRFFTSLAIFMTMQFLASVDSTAVGTVVATMTDDLNATTAQAEWIGNAYLLTSCAFQLPMSAFSDIFGRRAMVYITFALFMVGSLVTAVGKNMTTVIAGRTVQGVGAAGCLVLPEVFVADVIPLRLRGLYYAYLCGIWALGAAVGPVMGGALAQYTTWRWLFYINLPICGLALVATPFGLRLKPISDNWKSLLRRVDYVGTIAVIGSATSVVLAMSLGGTEYEWKSWRVIFPLVLGFVGFIVVGFYEVRYAQVPIFNPRVFANISAILSFAQNTLQGIVAMAALYYLPVYFQGVLGYGQLISGVALLPLNLVGTPASLLAGLLITRTGHYHFITWISWACAVLGGGILLIFDLHTSVAQLIFLQFPAALGIGALYSSLSTSVIATNAAPEWTSAAAFMSFSRGLGDVFGTAIGGSVFASQMRSQLANVQTGQVEADQAFSIVTYIRHLPTDSPLRIELQKALTTSVHGIFYVMLAVSALGLLMCFVIQEYSLDRTSETQQGIEEE